MIMRAVDASIGRASSIVFALLICMGFPSCAIDDSGSSRVRYQGHYTLGAARSTFIPIGSKDQLLVTQDDLPNQVYEKLKVQPEHADVASESGKSVSVFADVEGVLLHDSFGTPRFKALKVYSVAPAKKDYVEAWAKWPPPTSFQLE